MSITNIIILLNIVMFLVQNTIDNGILLFGLNIYMLKFNLWHQIITTMFVHGGIAHISMNMMVLYQFGNQLEDFIGKIKFTILYIVGGLFTSIFSFLYMYYSSNWANLVGASGAISVLIGFLALKDKNNRKGLIIWILLISFAPLLLGFSIAWYAHLIGFALGWLIGYIL